MLSWTIIQRNIILQVWLKKIVMNTKQYNIEGHIQIKYGLTLTLNAFANFLNTVAAILNSLAEIPNTENG